MDMTKRGSDLILHTSPRKCNNIRRVLHSRHQSDLLASIFHSRLLAFHSHFLIRLLTAGILFPTYSTIDNQTLLITFLFIPSVGTPINGKHWRGKGECRHRGSNFDADTGADIELIFDMAVAVAVIPSGISLRLITEPVFCSDV